MIIKVQNDQRFLHANILASINYSLTRMDMFTCLLSLIEIRAMKMPCYAKIQLLSCL